VRSARTDHVGQGSVVTETEAVAAERITAASPGTLRRAVMLQGWHDLASVHWRYDPAVVQRLLPDGYRVDTFDDVAWVGLIPFHMSRIRLPGLPPFGPLSTFPETNIRTYIVDPSGRRGVWFASLDVTRLVPVLVAKATYQLPYGWSAMSIERHPDRITYTSRRRWPARGAASRVSVRIGERIADEDVRDLDHFLTARWALGSSLAGRLLWAEVDHGPWPLHRADVLELDQTLTRAAGLPDPEEAPYALWSPGVEVRVGMPRPVRGAVARRRRR
jgi:uncharacterized protein